MRLISSLAIAALLSLSAQSAIAACPDKTASISGTDATKTDRIAKDGTHAPLEGEKAPEPAAKDGSTMPLAEEEGAGNKDLATSQQDVEAQQQGDKTAAAQAQEDACAD
jgi:hypothetical protein